MDLYIFDMDGTFLDSMEFWKNAFGHYLQSKNIKTDQKAVDKVHEMTLDQAIVYLVDYYKLDEDPTDVKENLHSMLAHNYREVFNIDPFAKEYFTLLKENKKKIALATATQRSLVDIVLDRFDLRGIFDLELVSDEQDLHKNDGKYFVNAAKKLNIDPKKTIVFEDSLYAIKSAKSIGAKVVAITHQSNPNHMDKIKTHSDLHGPTLSSLSDELIKELNA